MPTRFSMQPGPGPSPAIRALQCSGKVTDGDGQGVYPGKEATFTVTWNT